MALEYGTRTLEFDLRSPADELFKVFVEAVQKNGHEAEIEAEDWEERKVTIKIISSRILRNFNTVTVTATITPKEEGDGSHVVWTMVYEKICDDSPDEEFSINNIFKMVNDLK